MCEIVDFNKQLPTPILVLVLGNLAGCWFYFHPWAWFGLWPFSWWPSDFCVDSGLPIGRNEHLLGTYFELCSELGIFMHCLCTTILWPTLMSKPKLREVQWLGQGHRKSKLIADLGFGLSSLHIQIYGPLFMSLWAVSVGKIKEPTIVNTNPRVNSPLNSLPACHIN